MKLTKKRTARFLRARKPCVSSFFLASCKEATFGHSLCEQWLRVIPFIIVGSGTVLHDLKCQIGFLNIVIDFICLINRIPCIIFAVKTTTTKKKEL